MMARVAALVPKQSIMGGLLVELCQNNRLVEHGICHAMSNLLFLDSMKDEHISEYTFRK